MARDESKAIAVAGLLAATMLVGCRGKPADQAPAAPSGTPGAPLLSVTVVDPREASKFDVMAWPKTPADRFGCFMETHLGFRDKKFNCALKGYRNTATLCRNPEVFYEGPAFPNEKAASIHPLVEAVELQWEGGLLQSVKLAFRDRLEEKEIRKLFDLPDLDSPEKAGRSNILDMFVAPCKSGSCFVMQGFERTSGNIGCGKPAPKAISAPSRKAPAKKKPHHRR